MNRISKLVTAGALLFGMALGLAPAAQAQFLPWPGGGGVREPYNYKKRDIKNCDYIAKNCSIIIFGNTVKISADRVNQPVNW